MAATFDTNDLNTGLFYFTPFQNQSPENGKKSRSFITNKEKTPIYIKSPKLFVKSVAEKHLTCEYIDDGEGGELKQFLSDLERVAIHFIHRSINEESYPMLPAWAGHKNLGSFLHSSPTLLSLIRTNTLRVKNSDNDDIPADKLNERCARIIFSPVCLDIDIETGKYHIGYYAFTAKEFVDERFTPPQAKSVSVPDFGLDPFSGV
jgi:hypothetical protein